MKKSIIAAATLFCAVVLSGCETDTTAKSTTKNDTADSSKADGASTASETSEDSQAFKIGDMLQTDKWEITVKSITSTNEIRVDYGAYHPDEGEKNVLVELSAKNISKNSETFLPAFVSSKDIKATLTYQDYNFTGTKLSGYKKDLLGTSINPLSEKTGKIAFALASDVADKTSEINVVFTENKKLIRLRVNKKCGF